MSGALLVMDFQAGVVERLASPDVLARAAEATRAARAAGVPVIFVRVAFRAGHPEVAAGNRAFSALRDAGRMLEYGVAIHPALDRRDDEPIVTKRRVSAFTGSDLEVLLRGMGVRSLVLCGIATGGVVLSTVREAADRDYELTVLRDACSDADDEVHRVLMEKVFPRQAAVIDVAVWAQRLRS
jgi:nicotinamidase-related amidase